MDRCALFVDASYLLADGAMAVHGTRHRQAVSWDYPGLLKLLSGYARERTGLPLLRCYWYEASIEGRRSPEHDALADLPGLKLRLGRIRPGRREGIETEMHRDLVTLARNGAIADAVVVSNDEDLSQVMADIQDLGIRTTVVHVAVDGNWTISRTLRQEADDIIEVAGTQLRPLVNLLAGVDTSSHLGAGSMPLSNGRAHSSAGPTSHQAVPTAPHAGPPAIYSGHPSLPPHLAPAPVPPAVTPASAAPAQPVMHAAPTMLPAPLPAPVEQPPQQPVAQRQLPEQHAALPQAPGPHAGQQQMVGPAAVMPQVPGAHQIITPAQPQALAGQQELSPPPVQGQPQLTQAQQIPVAAQLPAPPQSPTGAQSVGQPYPASRHGPYTGPQHGQAPGMQPQPPQTTTLAEAVKSAHKEGHDFGDSVARDAPALWLEAVLARKPRMPSDLEARLLQGSALPIDFLLHDEVRHALRRGFWDALERSRR